MSDDDWITCVSSTDEEWIAGKEELGLHVGKYMRAQSLPQLNRIVLEEREN